MDWKIHRLAYADRLVSPILCQGSMPGTTVCQGKSREVMPFGPFSSPLSVPSNTSDALQTFVDTLHFPESLLFSNSDLSVLVAIVFRSSLRMTPRFRRALDIVMQEATHAQKSYLPALNRCRLSLYASQNLSRGK